MVYGDDPNKAAYVDNFLRSYLEEEFGYLHETCFSMSKNNNGEYIIMTQLEPTIPPITFHSCAWHILTGLCDIVTALLFPILLSTYFQLPVITNVEYVQHVQQHLQSSLYEYVFSISYGTYIGIESRA